MKDWFPFTGYDFYSYLACGMFFLLGLSYWFTGEAYLILHEWSFSQGAFFIGLAYIVGQIIAIPASMILEHGFMRNFLRAPATLLLSSEHSKFEKTIEAFLIGRHYSPLPKSVISRIYKHAEDDTGLSTETLKNDVKEVFAPALMYTRKNAETCNRIDFFRNQYTFSRNMCMSSLLVFCLLLDICLRSSHQDDRLFMLFSFLISFGMLIRFVKFYSCCAAEILRCYANKGNKQFQL